ncbi:MAG: hypothetical protein J6W74_00245 [Bacteroidales bacterium]|nr:hypothetical protein [Bacteroidales bacterium]MBP5689324.1 hypothetical protein [Bacteroidales bacterium]
MTREEAKDYLANYRRMYADLAPEKMLEALDVILAEQPEVGFTKFEPDDQENNSKITDQ